MKRIICICVLAALCMCVLLPGKAQAVQTSGTCGKNTEWHYDEETATLHISGQGPMAFAGDPTWSGLADQVQRVVIEEGITSISSHAFDGFSVLSDIQIPKSVKRIENDAFHKCVSLKTIDLHDGIQAIWGGCFKKSGLTEIIIPKGVKTIVSSAFLGCEQLKTVVLHDEITEIGASAFDGCAALEEIELPANVTIIGDSAFSSCSNLKRIYLGEKLELIEMYAFGHCSNLEELVFPESLKTIYNSAFIECRKLNKITFQGAAVNISDIAFADISATVYYPSFFDSWKGKCMDYGGTLTWKAYDCTEHIVQTDPAKEPTCTEDGLTASSRCTRCNTVLQTQEVIPATGHTFEEWEIVDSSTEGVLAERGCETCGHIEQALLNQQYPSPPASSDTPTNPSDTPTDPTDAPTVPTNTLTEPTQVPADLPTDPTEAPAEPTRPDITVREELKSSPWGIVLIGILVIVTCGAAGFWFGRKRK